MTGPAISVVVPAARVDSSLLCCLRSLANQTAPREMFEVVLVLDGVEPPSDFLSSLNPATEVRVHVLASNQGRSRARNVGIRNARAPVIASLDADMVACPELIRNYLTAHAGGPGAENVACVGERKFADPIPDSGFEELMVRTLPRSDYRAQFYLKTDFLRNAAEPFWAFSTCNCSYLRESAIAAGLFDETVKSWGLEDQEFGYRLWKLAGTRFHYAADALAIHIEHPRDLAAEWQSWEENRRYFTRKHGLVFARPRYSVRNPRLTAGSVFG